MFEKAWYLKKHKYYRSLIPEHHGNKAKNQEVPILVSV